MLRNVIKMVYHHHEAYKALCDAGWLGLIIPEEYGGTGGDAVDLAILLEETGKRFEELAMWVFRTMTWGAFAVMAHGSEEQKNSFYQKLQKENYHLHLVLLNLRLVLMLLLP